MILGLVLGLIMATIGLYWWRGKAEAEEARQNPDELPVSDPGEMTGPTTPVASELTREQRRFFFFTTALAIGAFRAMKCCPPAARAFVSSIWTATICSPSKNGPWLPQRSSKGPMLMGTASCHEGIRNNRIKMPIEAVVLPMLNATQLQLRLT